MRGIFWRGVLVGFGVVVGAYVVFSAYLNMTMDLEAGDGRFGLNGSTTLCAEEQVKVLVDGQRYWVAKTKGTWTGVGAWDEGNFQPRTLRRMHDARRVHWLLSVSKRGG